MASTATEFDTDCKLMLHMDGTDGSTTFVDSSSAGRTMTAAGNAQIDTAQSVFGGASGLFDQNGDYVYAADSDDWNFGSGDFTTDLRARFSSIAASNYMVLQVQGLGTDYWVFYWLVTGSLIFQVVSASVTIINIVEAWTPSADTWYHLAVVKASDTYYLFVNGVKLGTEDVDTSPIPDFTAPLEVGGTNTGAALGTAGHLDEVRIVKGTAVWTANFTPPSAAYIPKPSSSMLMFF